MFTVDIGVVYANTTQIILFYTFIHVLNPLRPVKFRNFFLLYRVPTHSVFKFNFIIMSISGGHESQQNCIPHIKYQTEILFL